jgi:hypothetical protein
MKDDRPRTTEDDIRRITKWVEGLRAKKILRRLRVDAEVDVFQRARVQIFLDDHLTTVQTKPIEFHIPTMDFDLLYQRIEDELVECFRALVREKLAKHLVFKGTTPVDVIYAETDGEQFCYKV